MDQIDRARATAASICGAGQATRLQAEADIAGDGEMRKQRVVLEHDADVAPVRRRAGDVATRQFDARPASGAVQPGDQAQQGGLAAARRPQQRDEFAARDRQIDAIEHGRGAEALGDAANVEVRDAGCGHRSRHFLVPAIHPAAALLGDERPVGREQRGAIRKAFGLGRGRIGRRDKGLGRQN